MLSVYTYDVTSAQTSRLLLSDVNKGENTLFIT
jgi:hypothetical protein